jgi:hypothetical protein
VLLASEVRADIVALFHRNPGIIDTAEGIGRRIGLVPGMVLSDLEKLCGIGMITKKKFGSQEVFFLNRAKDEEIQKSIAAHLVDLPAN